MISYEHTPAMRSVCVALLTFIPEGSWIIYRSPFRWKRFDPAAPNDQGDDVLSNHYDGMDLPSLVSNFDYRVLLDLHHVAVVTSEKAAARADALRGAEKAVRDANDTREKALADHEAASKALAALRGEETP